MKELILGIQRIPLDNINGYLASFSSSLETFWLLGKAMQTQEGLGETYVTDLSFPNLKSLILTLTISCLGKHFYNGNARNLDRLQIHYPTSPNQMPTLSFEGVTSTLTSNSSSLKSILFENVLLSDAQEPEQLRSPINFTNHQSLAVQGCSNRLTNTCLMNLS